MLTEALFAAVAEAVFGYLLQETDLADRVRAVLGVDPGRKAFQTALARAYTAFVQQYPDLAGDRSLFDESFLKTEAAPFLAQLLTRRGHPDPAELARRWAAHLGYRDPDVAPRLAEVTRAAADFLTWLEAELAEQQALRPLWDVRVLEEMRVDIKAIREILERLMEQRYTQADIETWRHAVASGQVVWATGERSVALGGSANDVIITTGNGNIIKVFRSPDADTIRQVFQQFLDDAGDSLFARFAEAQGLAHHIRIREFQPLVKERTKDFIGRDFIFKAIDDLLASHDFPSGYIVISGEPGIGKTALIAQLVKQRAYVHHFNLATSNIRRVSDFLANICAQIIVKYNLEYRTLPDRATADSGFLLQLLEEAAKPENRPVVVLVDAIDEAEDVGLPTALNRLYLPRVLPEGVFFIVTTRPKADYRLLVDRRKDIYLDDQDPNNLADITKYIQNFIQLNADKMEQRFAQWNVTQGEFITVLTEKSEGNFMYLRHVLPDIRDGGLTVANIDDIRLLPQGLREYYRQHWRSMEAQEAEKFNKYYQPVICILAVVREPVTIEQVSEWTGLSSREIKEAIDKWREFLNVDIAHNGRQLYRLYHTSFQEFLRDEVGLKPSHEIIARIALRKIQW